LSSRHRLVTRRRRELAELSDVVEISIELFVRLRGIRGDRAFGTRAHLDVESRPTLRRPATEITSLTAVRTFAGERLSDGFETRSDPRAMDIAGITFRTTKHPEVF
jgi:hypothetical protein